jgi:hypothetical protein
MKRFAFLLVISLLVFFGCAAVPPSIEQPAPAVEPAAPAPEPVKPAPVVETPPPPVEPVPVSISEPEVPPSIVSQEVFNDTMAEVRQLIDRLNSILRGKDFRSWSSYLGEQYSVALRNPRSLCSPQQLDYFDSHKISIRTAQDYFNWIVVPAHSKDQVDTIEFVTETRVKVLMQDEENGLLIRIWDLEKVNNSWKLFPPVLSEDGSQ